MTTMPQKISELFKNPKSKSESAFVISVVEIALGSLIHGIKIPLGGHFLSMMQILFLVRFRKHNPDSRWTSESEISIAAALFKSLSPMGKKLTPMLALTAQGFIFSTTRALFRSDYFAAALGSVWGFVQPLFMAYLIFGRNLVDSLHWAIEKTQAVSIPVFESLIGVWLGLVVLKVTIVLIWVHRELNNKFNTEWLEKQIQHQHINHKVTQTEHSLLKRYFKAVTQPMFLVSSAMLVLFFYFSEHPNKSLVEWIVLALRPFGAMALIVFLFPYLIGEKTIKLINRMGFVSIASTLQGTLKILKDQNWIKI
jgi:hypothetical protein